MKKFKDITIVIDPGHGGKDPGGVGNGLKEKDLTLVIALLLGAILKAFGINIIYTRTTDVYVGLSARAKIANDANADLFISIHVNAGGGITANGVEIFSHPNSAKGMILSKDILNQILLDNLFKTNRGNKTANFAVLRLTHMPAVLTETGFIDHAGDAQILRNKQKEIAESMAKGILKNLGIKYIPDEPETNKLYKVQVGGYSVKSNAERLLKELADKGYKGFIVEEDVKVVKKKRVSYKGSGGSEIVEIDPLDLYIDVVKIPANSVQGDFVNGGFFDMSSMKSISTLVSNGKVLAEQLPHDNVKRGTMVVYKDGTVKVEMIDFITKHPNLNKIQFAISGFNILPSHGDLKRQLKSEWFNYNVVGYKTWRTMLGYSKKVNKVLAVVVPNMTAEEGQVLMQKLGCDIAIGLDSGGSTCGRFNNKTIRLVGRKLHNVIKW